ncbi:MAG: hypothetical protein P8Y67_04340 [Alphaproteobacteria bacterium]
MKVKVHASQNALEIKIGGLPKIQFLSEQINFEDRGYYDFALWAILPIIMRLGSYAKCKFSVSRACYDSVIAVSRIWARWLPELFTEPNFNVDIVDAKVSDNDRILCFFSGGIDSTYSAIRLQEQGVNNLDCLTIHGMDYRFPDINKFQALMDRTSSFRSRMFNKSLVVRTNLYSVYNSINCNPHDGHITHIFALFSCGSLFPDYGTYLIASDYRRDQQFSAHPYGSNSVTNSLIRNANGRLVTRDDDVSRCEKAKKLLQTGIDLSSLSICVDYEFRPQNCGVCSKCVRTKAMFYATSKNIPNIFHDMSIGDDWYKSIDLNSKPGRVFCGDILDAIRLHGLENELGYSEAKKLWEVASVNARNNSF